MIESALTDMGEKERPVMIVNLNGFVEDLTVEQLEGSGTSPPNAPKFRFFWLCAVF